MASPSQPLRWQRPRCPSIFICPTTASVARAAAQLALDDAEDSPGFWPEMKYAARIGRVVAAICAVKARMRDGPVIAFVAGRSSPA